MHGVRRGSRSSGKVAAEELERARNHADILHRALTARESGDVKTSWKLTRSAVELFPDEYSLWNWRRAQLRAVAEEKLPIAEIAKSPEQSIDSLWTDELVLTMCALKRHPKAYPAWQHRLWLLGWEHASKPARKHALSREQALISHMLALDGRNFHSWAHRLRVGAITTDNTNSTKEDELEFVTQKINTDFANYSAWHVRSKLLCVNTETLESELDFVRQAFYTEPDVQSTWFYHRWLLAGMPGPKGRVQVDESMWKLELDACNELLELEPDARWVLHSKAHILDHLNRRGEAVRVFEKLTQLVSIWRSIS